MRNDEFLMKIDPGIIRKFILNKSCWSAVKADGCYYEERFFKRLGGPYYNCTGYLGDSVERKQVYSKKGDKEWGEKMVVTGAPNINNYTLKAFSKSWNQSNRNFPVIQS